MLAGSPPAHEASYRLPGAWTRVYGVLAAAMQPGAAEGVAAVSRLKHDDFRLVYTLSLRSNWRIRLG